jgi:hypothetical protein
LINRSQGRESSTVPGQTDIENPQGIQTFPREFGRGASATSANIIASIGDTVRTYRTIFQADYDLPANRSR